MYCLKEPLFGLDSSPCQPILSINTLHPPTLTLSRPSSSPQATSLVRNIQAGRASDTGVIALPSMSSPNHSHSHSQPSPHSTHTKASSYATSSGGGGGGSNSGGGGGGSALKRLLQQRRPPSPTHRTHPHDPPPVGNNYIGSTRSVQSLSVVNSVALARPASATNHQRPRFPAQGPGLGPGPASEPGLVRPSSASVLGRPPASSTGGRATDKGLTLSHHDSHMLFKLNPKVRGYMGYEFPKNVKPLKRDYYNAARPPELELDDVAWLYTQALIAQRVLLFDAADHHHPPTHSGIHYDDFEYAVREYGSRDFARDWIEFIAVARADHQNVDGGGGGNGGNVGGSVGGGQKNHTHGDSPALAQLRNELQGLKDHPVTAALLFGKGEWYRFLKQEKNTLPFLQASLSMRQRVHQQQQRPDHPDIADSLDALAELFRAKNIFAKADVLYANALEVRERAYRLLTPPAVIKSTGPPHKDKGLGLGSGPGSDASGGVARGLPPTLIADDEGNPEGGLFSAGGASTCIHPSMTMTMQRLGTLRYVQGDLTGAKALFEGWCT